MAELYFVRHCEPEGFSHSSDNYNRVLTPKGLEDTAYVTSYLEEQHVDTVLSSPYLRAMQTVEPFARKHNIRIEKAFDLCERRLAIFLDSENFLPFVRRQWADFNYREADGESLREVQNRCIAVVEDVLERYPMGHVALGGHGTAICTVINRYYPGFGFPQFMQLVDIMPFIAHLSFYGQQCERIEFIDPRPFVPPTLHERTGELVLSEPRDERRDFIDLRDFRAEFAANNERIYCASFDRYDDTAKWLSDMQNGTAANNTRVWLARRASDSRLVGVMSLSSPYNGEDSIVSDVYVSVRQSERWKGYGAELIMTAKETAGRTLNIVCDSGSIPARKAIESAGGVPVNMTPAPFGLYESGLARRYTL